MTTGRRPIVIVGLPRSGTTWSIRVLGAGTGCRRVLEPDNEDHNPAAIQAKKRLGRYPLLAPGDKNDGYRQLWEWILNGAYEGTRARRARQLLAKGGSERIFEGKPDVMAWAAGVVARGPNPATPPPDGVPPERVITKSIHAQLSLEWVTSEFDVDTLVLLRHPANVLASWMAVNLKDSRNSTLETRPEIRKRYIEPWGVPLPGPDPIERMSWRIGLLIAALEDAVRRNPSWQVRVHEDLCVDPTVKFRALYDSFDLPWTEATESFLHENDRPGDGFMTRRVASDLPQAWQQKLDDTQVATLRRVLAQFPIASWSDQDFERTTPRPT